MRAIDVAEPRSREMGGRHFIRDRNCRSFETFRLGVKITTGFNQFLPQRRLSIRGQFGVKPALVFARNHWLKPVPPLLWDELSKMPLV
jgi:hypothetical protein